MSDRAPAVSIVVPTAGREPMLAACLTALRKQRLADFEAIVVDDASTDGMRRAGSCASSSPR